jgi:hypothetical protein
MSYMHEVRRYDGEGKLIETISPAEVKRRYWAEFVDLSEQEHTPESLANVGTISIRNGIVRKKSGRVCAHCGKSFLGGPRAKFCPFVPEGGNCKSRYYQAEAAKKRDALPPIKCKMCGKDFKAVRGTYRKFCHDPCTHHLLIESRRPAPRDYDCLSCGKAFKSVKRRGFAKYCHAPCTPDNNEQRRVAARNRRRVLKAELARGLKMIDKICSLCEKPFKTHKKNRIYCGEPCSDSESKKVGRAEYLCKLCREPMKQGTVNRKYCGEPCNYELYHAQLRRDAVS